jgi:hypothetical protein
MKPFTLKQAQRLVEDAVDRSKPRHKFWHNLEVMYRTGQHGSLTPEVLNGTLFDVLSGDDLETVNLVMPKMRLQIARLTSRDPRPVAHATSGGPRSEDTERIVESVLDYHWTRQNGTMTVRDMAQDMVVCGNAFAKIGWSYSETEFPVSREEREQEAQIMFEVEREAALMQGRDPMTYDEILAAIPKTVSVVVQDEPYISYLRPIDVFVPTNARRLDESRWVAQRVIMPLDEAKFRYPDSDIVPVVFRDEHYIDDEDHDLNSSEEFAELFEFWDQATRTLMVFQMGSDKPCYEGDWPHQHRYLPFVHIANNRGRPSDFWGFGEMQQLAGLQHRFNEVWTKIIDSTFRSGRKYLALKGSLDEEAVVALESDEDEQVVFVDGMPGENPANMVSPMLRQPISGEVLNAQNSLMGLMNEVLAFSDFDAGGVGADRMSATAAAAVMQVSESRATDKQMLVEEAGSRIFLLLLLICQQYMTEDTVVRIAGPDGTLWPTVTSEDLQGEFKIRVETGSMNGESRSLRRSEGVQLLTQVTPALAQLGYDTDGVVRSALKRMGYDPDELGVMKMQPQMPAGMAGPADPGMLSNGGIMEALSGLPGPADTQEAGGI